MPSKTFLNLNPAKKNRITSALLKEFSKYPLSKAQVSRIVKDAEIARGAFYKYFDSLNDAYQYLLNKSLKDIHADFTSFNFHDVTFIFNKMQDFIEKIQQSPYFDFFKLHFEFNEVEIGPYQTKKNLGTIGWMIATLSHETIKAIFADFQNQSLYLQRFKQALQLIKEE